MIITQICIFQGPSRVRARTNTELALLGCPRGRCRVGPILPPHVLVSHSKRNVNFGYSRAARRDWGLRSDRGAMSGNTTTYRRPSVSIGMGLDGADYSYLTKPNKDGTGFFVTFNVPFKKQDVFNELLSDSGPLGFDEDAGVTTTILKSGREQGKLVSTSAIGIPCAVRTQRCSRPHFPLNALLRPHTRRCQVAACAKRNTRAPCGGEPSPSCVKSRRQTTFDGRR